MEIPVNRHDRNENETPPMTPLDPLSEAIASRGWGTVTNFLDQTSCAALRTAIDRWHAEGLTRPAGIGTGDTLSYRPDIRGDHIIWLDSLAPPAQAEPALAALETLRVHFNRTLFLGLRSFEGHVALYPPGAFYAKHIDRPRGSHRRIVSCVLYLNAAWTEACGGHLRIYRRERPDDVECEIPPREGTLACFLAGETPHEVRPMQRARYSLTGWFLND